MQTKANIQDIAPYQPGVLKTGAIKLASNENPLGSSPKALAALKENLDKLHLYPDGGCIRLKNALAAHYGLTPEYFLPGNGSDEIFHFITGAFVSPDDRVLTADVTFSEYTFAAKLFAGAVDYAPITDGKIQLDALLPKITPRTKVIFLANPNNPTGAYFTAAKFENFLPKVPAEIMVVIDEAYAEYAAAADYPDTLRLLKTFKNLPVARIASRVHSLHTEIKCRYRDAGNAWAVYVDC
ncbi:histidinol-phosphate aminotransferase, partial [Candidatus Termititenax aidoneus]